MPKRVKGPTDHVVVVGAGLAGLSAALRLAGAGRKVTVIERESVPGGRNGLLNKDGYAFDTGPSVLTMPSLINDAFNSVGEELKDWLELTPVQPLYRAFYADGSQIDVHANTEQMEAEIAKTVSSAEAAGYRRYVDFVTKLYKYEMIDFHSSRPGHDLRYSLSGDYLKSLGWEPKITFSERIKQVVHWTLENDRWLK